MNRTLGYVAIAVILGIGMIFLPTWSFLAIADQQGKFVEAFERLSRQNMKLPLMEYSEESLTVSSNELGVLGISFAAASIVYVLFKQRASRDSYLP